MSKFNKLQNITRKLTSKNTLQTSNVKYTPITNTIKTSKPTLLEQINSEIENTANKQSINPLKKIKKRLKTFVKKNIEAILNTQETKSNSSKLSKLKHLIASKRTYINSKTVQELESAEFIDFINKSKTFITESLGIPKTLNAKIYFNDMENKNNLMFYSWTKNQIGINYRIINYKKSKIFGILRHEIQHQKQIFDAMRTEDFGEGIVKKMAKKEARDEINYIIKESEHYSSNELKARKYELKKKFLNLYNKHLYKFNNLRYTIIKEMGQIPAGDDFAKSVRTNMDILFNNNQTEFKRNTSNIEGEAYISGLIGELEYRLAKWLSE